MIERDIPKIKIIVFVENEYEREMYFKLFQFMLKDQIEQMRTSKHEARIYADQYLIEFLYARYGARGHKAHYVFNLTQDKEFDSFVAKPITNLFTMLKDDPKWSELVVKRDDYV